MRNFLRVSRVQFTSASPEEVRTGLLGWASGVLNQVLCIQGIAIRRTLSGNFAISFPVRKDRCGRKYAILRPLNDRVRLELQHQILQAIGLQEDGRRP